jgi:uncharacterized membrane protein
MLRKITLFLGVLLSLLAYYPFSETTAATHLSLYTPYTGISVTPGETIDYSFEIINDTSDIQHVSFRVEDLPDGWNKEITSGGWQLEKLSVKPNESEKFSVNVEVPLQVTKNTYQFYIVAESGSGIEDRLPMTVNISEKGTFKTELSSEQPNMEGSADSSFTYELSLRNRTAQEQLYSLTADAPRGWDVNFEVDSKSVTSVTVESNSTKDIRVAITPPQEVKAGEYQIPIKASTSSTSAETTLEAVITGNFDIQLSTPTGRLSEDITAGKEKTIELEVSNTGTVPLRDIDLKAKQPVNWEVTFEPEKIVKLDAGKTETVRAKIKASEKAIAGDYVVELDATTPEVSSKAQFRMQVETSMLWGWVGVLLIVGVLVGIYYFIYKYGRR